jgi:cytochrome b561
MGTALAFQQPRSLFHRGYSLTIRIWHWLTFIIMTASIVMVLLASTLYPTREEMTVIQRQVQLNGGSISPAQARVIVHTFNDQIWMVHKYIGFGLCFLLFCRVIIEAAYSKEERLVAKIRNAFAFQTQNEAQRYDRKHYILVKFGYVVFYALFLIMALSGLGLAFEEVQLFRSIHGLLANIHNIVQYLIYLYIFFHIAGVIRADLTNSKGIVSRMINGGRS